MSPLICSANQWTGFYMIQTSVMKELKKAGSGTYFQWLTEKNYVKNYYVHISRKKVGKILVTMTWMKKEKTVPSR